MFTRLLLKLAGPVPSLKKRAVVRRLLNTARYPLKTRAIDTRRCIILRRIHRPSKIRRATEPQKPWYSIARCIELPSRIFLSRLFLPPFLEAIREIFWSRKLCDVRYICRKGVMCQDCLTAALPIVSPLLCLLSCFLANNGNGKLSLDGYFGHQQSVIQHLWRWRAPSVNLQTARMLDSWPLDIAPAHSRVG